MNQRSKQLFKDTIVFIKEANKDTQQSTKMNAVKNFIQKPLGKDLLKYTYNNTNEWVFGLTSKSMETKVDSRVGLHDAIWAVQNFCDTPEEKKILANILDKNLKVRMGADLINKVQPDLVEVFDVVLANKYDSFKHDLTDNYYLSRKFDGARVVTIINLSKKEVSFYSREGNKFLTLEKLIPGVNQMALAFRDVTKYDGIMVFDGEVSVVTPNDEDDFRAIIKQIKSFKKGCVENPRYHIIDILTEDEFYARTESRLFKDRYDAINNAYKLLQQNSIFRSLIHPVLQTKVTGPDVLQTMIVGASAAGWEGLIARLDAPYRSGRHNDLLKIKEMQTLELKVVDIETGPFQVIDNGKTVNETTMTNVVCDYEGFKVSVGSGFTLADRRKYYNDPKSIIGKLIEVQYFEKTENQNGGKSLRFPIFKGERNFL